MAQVELSSVRVALPTNTPVVLLREMGGLRTLPIYIGTVEATAIAYALQGIETPRPMTHDLLMNIIDSLGAVLDRVVITELQGDTFYADLELVRDGKRVSVSARPSDALALAVRTQVPIFADDDLIDAEGIVLDDEIEDGTSEEQEEVVARFREFINEIKPEDFSS
jgi:bifunctional DNase/RNase